MCWAIAARQDARFLVFDFGCGTLDVVTDRNHICLNRDNPAFIVADPPFQRDRDTERLICAFRVDGHRRLLVTVRDTLAHKLLLEDHPVMRL